MTMTGLVRFGRYAFGPNRFGYCGPPDYKAVLEYVASGKADVGLLELATRFDGAFPYLSLIAHSNGLDDPFDDKVVEAYWVGNSYLKTVRPRQMHEHVEGRFAPRMPKNELRWLEANLESAHPHHNFHVLQIYKRAGLHGDPGSSVAVSAMDSCRVSWGKVRAVLGDELVVERRPLQLFEGKLGLGEPELKTVERHLAGLGFVETAKPGDIVSVHWGWACEVLTPSCLSRLERATLHYMGLANETI
jgi:hypothetical protein